MANIHVFQHVPFEGPAMIGDWARERNHLLSHTAFHQADHLLPEGGAVDALVIMGGPMGVADEADYPWLKEEKAFIAAAIEAGTPALGVCLGAQLIAAALGAEVRPMGYREIGWFPVAFRDEALGLPLLSGLNTAMTVLHWHGDRFAIPPEAIPLAASEACDNQGFLHGGKVLGLQFHLEMDAWAVSRIVEACRHELEEGGRHVQDAQAILERSCTDRRRATLYRLLDNWWACAMEDR